MAIAFYDSPMNLRAIPWTRLKNTGFSMSTDASNQIIVVTQHRFNGKWYGMIRYSDGRQSGIFGPFKSNQQAMQSLRQTLDTASQSESQSELSGRDFNDLAI